MVFQRISVVGPTILLLIGILANNKICAETSAYSVEVLPDSSSHLGEGPHWDVSSQNLYMVDILLGELKRLDYAQNKMYKCKIENETLASFVIPIEGLANKFAVGIGRQVAIVDWDGISKSCKVETTILSVEQGNTKYDNNRFNDAKCDPCGRLFLGTMDQIDHQSRAGSLYRLLKINESEVVVGNVALSNGLTWDEKANKFYFIDSIAQNVKAYDYDIDSGEIKNPKVVFDLLADDVKTTSVPDGMTIDSDGILYVAINGGSAVYKVNPKNGEILQKIKIPSKQVTSVAFGGPNLDILYVTAANETVSSGRSPSYKVTGLGVKGLPMEKLKLCFD